MTIQDYLALLSSEHSEQLKFTAMVAADVSPMVQVQTLLVSMIPLFDLDQARGNQLDIIGAWVGVSRQVAIPIAGIYFSWDDTTTDGWDYGSWQPSLAPTTVTSLPDDAYLTLIRAKIAANQWDGTTTDAYAIWNALFPNFTILIQDHQDMTYDLAIVGGLVDALTFALISGGYIPLKPSGIKVQNYYAAYDSGPVFAWDLSNTELGGWDSASWARVVNP